MMGCWLETVMFYWTVTSVSCDTGDLVVGDLGQGPGLPPTPPHPLPMGWNLVQSHAHIVYAHFSINSHQLTTRISGD